jgi:hypothetical protein
LLAVIGVLAVGGLFGFRIGHDDAAAEYQVQIDGYKQRIDEANYRAAVAAFRYEEWKERQEQRSTVVVKEISRVAKATPAARTWSDQRLPDSVRDAAARAAADVGASKPAPSLPAVPATRASDQPRSSLGLHLSRRVG